MGSSLPFGKERKIQKLIRNYIKDRAREKRAFNEQIKRLDAQFDDEQINWQTYERFRMILENQYYQRQEEEWAKTRNNFQNTINS